MTIERQRRRRSPFATAGMRVARTLLAAALAACVWAAPGLGQAERHAYTLPHVLRYATAEDIVGLNNHLNAQGTLAYMSSLTMAWLVKFDHENRPVPELAVSIPTQANHGISADGKTITYHLRSDAKWSDGVPFSSADVVFSVAVVQDADNNEQTHAGFEEIAAVEAPNPTTVVFHLRRPFSSYYVNFFSSGGANPCILPKHKFSSTKINTAAYNDLPVGIGPFKYASWRRNDAVEMVADPLYFRGRPRLDRVVFKLIPDRNTTLTQLMTHEIDLWLPVSPAFADRVKGLPGIEVLQQPSYLYDHVDLNCAHPPLDDPVVRAALRLAIDRPTILAKIRHGNGLLQEGVLAPTHRYFDPSIARIPFDIARANALLDRAGWQRGSDGIRAKSGKRLEFVYATGVGLPDTDQQIELIRTTWKQIGADFSVQHYPSSTFFAPAQAGGILDSGKWDVTNFAWTDPVDGDVFNIYGCDRVPPRGQNVNRFCDPAADRAMRRLLASYDPKAERAAALAVQEVLVRDVATVVIEIRKDTYAYNSDLRNFHPNTVTPFDDMRDVDI
jgi:peptide/nickel transport system substrate-binding protein